MRKATLVFKNGEILAIPWTWRGEWPHTITHRVPVLRSSSPNWSIEAEIKIDVQEVRFDIDRALFDPGRNIQVYREA